MSTAEKSQIPNDPDVVTETTDSEDAPTNNDSPPNGGMLAWLQVAGCFALYLNTL